MPAYGSFIFPVYLEQKVANYDAGIIRQIWDYYGVHRLAGTVEQAIDQVLSQYGNKSLKTEFPIFARNNYFLNAGTYEYPGGQPRTVYKQVEDLASLVNWPEWQLFRSRLLDGRENYQGKTAAVLKESVLDFPADGPSVGKNNVEEYGARYIEFIKPNGIAPGKTLTITVAIANRYMVSNDDVGAVEAYAVADFDAPPISPVQGVWEPGPDPATYPSQYVVAIPDFAQYDRVVLMVSNFIGEVMRFRYHAEIAP